MAINKVPEKASLVMEIQSGVDELGGAVYKRKSFSDVNPEATAENIHAVATAISEVLANPTRNFRVIETSAIEQAEI